jgi:urease accessory protein
VFNLGIARLRTELQAGVTVVAEQYSQAPLQLHRPLYLENDAVPVVYFKTPSSGLLGGDEHKIEAAVGGHSQLELRTQAATVAYRGRSAQHTKIRIEPGGKLVFHPHLLILGTASNLTQRVSVHLFGDAELDYQEEWCVGRIAMGERWRFERFDYGIEVWHDDALKFRERWCINPASQPLQSPVICGDFTHFQTRLLFGQRRQIETNESDSAISAIKDWQRQWTLKRVFGQITRRSYRQEPNHSF